MGYVNFPAGNFYMLRPLWPSTTVSKFTNFHLLSAEIPVFGLSRFSAQNPTSISRKVEGLKRRFFQSKNGNLCRKFNCRTIWIYFGIMVDGHNGCNVL